MENVKIVIQCIIQMGIGLVLIVKTFIPNDKK